MQATETRPTDIEVLARGGIDELLALQDEVVRHGDNVWFELAWQDPATIPEVVALDLEAQLQEIGCIPADGQPVMVVADPDHLRVWVNYREQSPDLGQVTLIIGGIGLLAAGGAFFLFREQAESVLGENTNTILLVITVASIAVLGIGAFMALNPGRQRRALASGR